MQRSNHSIAPLTHSLLAESQKLLFRTRTLRHSNVRPRSPNVKVNNITPFGTRYCISGRYGCTTVASPVRSSRLLSGGACAWAGQVEERLLPHVLQLCCKFLCKRRLPTSLRSKLMRPLGILLFQQTFSVVQLAPINEATRSKCAKHSTQLRLSAREKAAAPRLGFLCYCRCRI